MYILMSRECGYNVPFSFAKYLSYEPCFISTPLLPGILDDGADIDPGRIRVIDVRVEFPRDGTL